MYLTYLGLQKERYLSMPVNEKDNFWLKFLDYKRLRDGSITLTVETLKDIIDNDTPFTDIVTLNPTHENYAQYKEIVDALQTYHSHIIDMLRLMKDTLEAEVNVL